MKETTLLSIKDFSEFTGVKQSTLRYYDEIGLLPPVSRGENNYRHYVPYQIILLSFINVLIELGVPLSMVKEMSKSRTPEKVIELLNRQEEKLDVRLYELQQAYSVIHTFRKNIETGLTAKIGEVNVVELEELNIVLGPETDFEENQSFYVPFVNFCNSAHEYRINLRYPIGGYHNDIDQYLKTPGEPNRFFSQDPIGNVKREAGNYLVVYNQGYYGEFPGIRELITSYAEEHNLGFHGPVYVLYLLDEISTVEREKYVSRIAVRVEEKKKRY